MTRRWLGWVVLGATTILTGCPGRDTPAGVDTEGGTETETDTEGTGSASSVTMTSSSPTSNDTAMTASGTATSTSTTAADTGSTVTTDPTTAGTDGCPPGTEGCPCDVGSTCDGDLQCVEGTCVGEQPCDNPEGEPNDTETEAVELDTAYCNDDATVVPAALEGAEADWFTYQGDEPITGCGFFGGSPSATAMTDEGPLQVCFFATCSGGNPPNINFCPMGLQAEDSPDGLPGCCGDDMASLPSVSCGFMNGDPTYLVRVSGGEDGACTPYNLAYDYTG